MARIRTIKPSMFTSMTVSSWPIEVRWTFAGLLTYVDDQGRGLDEPRLIKAEVWPLDDKITAKKVDEHLKMLTDSGPVCRYTEAGKPLLHIVSWREHQRVNRPTPSKFAQCPTHCGGRDSA